MRPRPVKLRRIVASVLKKEGAVGLKKLGPKEIVAPNPGLGARVLGWTRMLGLNTFLEMKKRFMTGLLMFIISEPRKAMNMPYSSCLKYKNKPLGTGCKVDFMGKTCCDGSGGILSRSGAQKHIRLEQNRRSGKDKCKKSVIDAVKSNCTGGFKVPFVYFTPLRFKKSVSLDEHNFMPEQIPPRQANMYNWLSGAMERKDGDYMSSKNDC
ncbi:hypothetical protein FGB62_273g01 [Gracilaria domingensis]|nr:hypothetical protein FGB62_273g01 [Gracilaria domingensis]